MSSYIVAGDNAVGTLAWTLKETGANYNVFTATFTGDNGGSVETIDVTVRPATDAEKVAHDKAALEAALDDIEELTRVANSDVTVSNIKTEIQNAIENELAHKWSTTIAATVVDEAGYTQPTEVGNTAPLTCDITITITSGTVSDTIVLNDQAITVELTA